MEHTRLYIIRHGQVAGFSKPAYNGHTDVDLTDLGRAQLDAAAEDLKEVALDAVYSSDLKRARYGGEALAKLQGLDLKLNVDFREIFFGDWEGLSFEQVEERYPGELDKRMGDIADHRIPGAETIREFWNRVREGMDRLLSENHGKNIALVAHSGVNRVILLSALGCGPELIWRMDQSFGCLNIVDYFKDGVNIIRLANGPNRASNGFI